MFRRILQFSITALAVALVASAQSIPMSSTINLHSSTQVENKTLPPGEYRVVVEANNAGNDLCAFVSPVKNGRRVIGGNVGSDQKLRSEGIVVAEVPCTLKTQTDHVSGSDFAVIEQDRLTEIQFSGKNEAVDFAL